MSRKRKEFTLKPQTDWAAYNHSPGVASGGMFPEPTRLRLRPWGTFSF